MADSDPLKLSDIEPPPVVEDAPPALEGGATADRAAAPFRHFFAEVAAVESGDPIDPDAQATQISIRATSPGLGAAAVPPSDWVVADTYRIEELIREGGMGRVYRARHTGLDRIVCLKTLRPDMAQGADGELLIERFKLEAQAAGRIDHPNVIRILDFGQDSTGQLYLAMDFVDGVDLEALLREAFPLGEERVCHIMAQVLDALVEAHAHGVVHRDLKPGNIMVEQRPGEPDFVRVVDFGIAKVQGTSKLTATGFVTGTAQYMAPEQAAGQDIDARTDLYAVGCVLYELVTRTIPFGGDNATSMMYAHVHTPPEPPRVRRPEVVISPELEALILKALKKNPDERPPSAEVFRDELLRLAAAARQRRAQALTASEALRREEEAATLAARLAQLQGSATTPTSQRTLLLPAQAPPPPAPVAQGRHTLTLVAIAVAAVSLALAGYLALRASPAPVIEPDPAPEVAAPPMAEAAPTPEKEPPIVAVAPAPTEPSPAVEEVAEKLPPPDPVVAARSPVTDVAAPAPPPREAPRKPVESMVRLAGGVAVIGCDETMPNCPSDAQPALAFDLKPYRIDRNEVTAHDYLLCVQAGACSPTRTDPGCVPLASGDRRPINCVSWGQADTFCRWRGARLPSEFEWEHAARGAGGRIYPWGDDAPTCERATFGSCPSDRPASVGARPKGATPEGISDLAGNVREWTRTYYSRNTYVVGREPRTGPGRVVRGGSFENTTDRSLAAWSRVSFAEDRSYPNLGFRCAR